MKNIFSIIVLGLFVVGCEMLGGDCECIGDEC